MHKGISILGIMFILLLNVNTVSANVIGDINGDGTVGLAEALFVLQVGAGLQAVVCRLQPGGKICEN